MKNEELILDGLKKILNKNSNNYTIDNEVTEWNDNRLIIKVDNLHYDISVGYDKDFGFNVFMEANTEIEDVGEKDKLYVSICLYLMGINYEKLNIINGLEEILIIRELDIQIGLLKYKNIIKDMKRVKNEITVFLEAKEDKNVEVLFKYNIFEDKWIVSFKNIEFINLEDNKCFINDIDDILKCLNETQDIIDSIENTNDKNSIMI